MVIFLILLTLFLILTLQTYVTAMRQNLESTEDPLDVKLEAAIPGLHTRLTALSQQLANLDANDKKLAKAIEDLKGQDPGEPFRLQMANSIERALEGFKNGLLDGPSLSQVAPQVEVEQIVGQTANTLPASAFKTVDLSSRFKSLYDLWYEWFGLEHWQGKPIVGGFARMEENFPRGAWRKHFSSAKSRQFTRVKAIAQGLHNKFREENVEDEDKALETLNTVFKLEHNSEGGLQREP